MYERFWGFSRKPFDDAFHPEFFYPGELHQGALLKLRYCVEQRMAAGLLVGPSGVGKTFLVRKLLAELDEQQRPRAHVVYPQMSAEDWLVFLAGELTDTGVEPRSAAQCWQQLRNYLSNNTAQGQHAVLVVDEGHLIQDARCLETLRLLLNFQSDGHPDLTILLVGQPALLSLLAHCSGWSERFSVKCFLAPFNAADSARYIRHRLTVAGGRNNLFTPEAIAAVFRLSEGQPRRIDRLCDLALLVGFAEESREIGAPQIFGVHAEMATFGAADAA